MPLGTRGGVASSRSELLGITIRAVQKRGLLRVAANVGYLHTPPMPRPEKVARFARRGKHAGGLNFTESRSVVRQTRTASFFFLGCE